MENDISRDLSIWMFDDKNTLKREPTSGATKHVYCGDIFPMKQINWINFPFLIETKTGYEQHTPTFWNYSKVIDWFNKSLKESQIHNQHIILLICRFKNKPILLFTNFQIKLDQITPLAIIPNIIDDEILGWINVYSYKQLLQINFYDIFGEKIEYR
ncbi:MAG: hypothetical protein PHD05_00250 [Sphaerochaetaceae bacterium]|nr:hypothetical protein [Sphaerochaetaceae bacterium]